MLVDRVEVAQRQPVGGRHSRAFAPIDVASVLAFGAAVAVVASIAVSQILLGLALLALIVLRRLELPPIKLPLALFVAATLVAVLLSPSPAHALPQVKKLYVLAILPAVFTTFTRLAQVRALFLTWAALGGISALRGFYQFNERWHEAIRENAVTYNFFLDSRIHGFASHWMTFGGQEMITFLVLAAFVLFARPTAWKVPSCIGLGVLWAALVLGLTRSIFLLGLPAGGFYLLCQWRRYAPAAIPAVGIVAFLFAPPHVRERVTSIARPHGDVDSNGRHEVMRRAGWAMVKAHPWFGIGPEQIGPQFAAYVPADVPRPLPRGWYGHLHNIYLQYAAERGVPALLFLLWFIAKCMWDFHCALRLGAGAGKFVLHAGIAVIIAVLAAGWFEYNLGDSEVLTMFLTVMACGYSVCRPQSDVPEAPVCA